MFRVLIVENDPDDMKDLVDAIHLTQWVYPISLDEADNIADAACKIEAANRSQHPYDAAVLDFELPITSAPDSLMEMNESLCLACCKYGQASTYVIHCTAHREHPNINAHLERYHSLPGSPPAKTVYKDFVPGEYDYAREVAELLKSYLYSRKIRLDLDALFGHESDSETDSEPVAFNRFQSASMGGGLSDKLMLLTDEITLGWEALDEDTKQSVRKAFYVDESVSPIVVSLLSPASP